MKKYLLISTIAFMLSGCFGCGNGVKAQGIVTATFHSTATGSVDSIRCNGTVAAYLYVVPSIGNYVCAAIQPTTTRKSTAIGGTIFLQGSIDGTNYFNATYAAGDTITVTDAASTVCTPIQIKSSTGLPFKYYRLKCTGASSDTMTVRAVFCGRQ